MEMTVVVVIWWVPNRFIRSICSSSAGLLRLIMMTSSNEKNFRVTGPLCGEFTGPGEFPTQRPVTRSFDVSLICAWIKDWVNNREAGDLRRHLLSLWRQCNVIVWLPGWSKSESCRGEFDRYHTTLNTTEHELVDISLDALDKLDQQHGPTIPT